MDDLKLPTGQQAAAAGGELHFIGWKEYLDFPDWNLHKIKVKIDTGARTSALDVLTYELREDGNHGLTAELRLCLKRRYPEKQALIRTPVIGMVIVKNTGGVSEQRPLIETTIRLGPVTKRVRLTVTHRSGLRFPVILGRKALEGDFIVDVSKKYLLRSSKK
jgi:hypothetical protein